MSEPSSFLDPDMVAIARRASALGVNSDGHLADVFGMDMLEAATSPTGYTAAEAYYALDQATEPSDYMGARNVGTMGLEEAAEIFGAYVEGYKEAIALSDGDTFGGILSAGRIKRYNKQLDRYKSARDDNDQKKAAKALGRMRALWGRMSSADREGLVSPDKASVPGVEISKQAFPKAAAMDAQMSADDESSTDAADAESNAEEAMGEAFGAGGVKAYKNRKAYIELILRGRADGSLSLSAIEPLYNAIKVKRGLPTPAQVMEGAPVTADMIIPVAKVSQSMMGIDDLDIFGAEDLDIFAEANAGNVMGVVFGADGAKDYLNRKAYVEAAVKAVASGRIGKVNLVRLWKAVEGRQGLPSPSEIKSGAVVTLDMIIPPVSSVPEASAPSLPSLAAFGAGGVKEYRKRKRYVEAAVRAVAEGRVDDPALDMLWAQVKGRRGLPSPEQLEAGATITMDMVMPLAKAAAPVAMGYSFGDDLPEDDSDIDAELGADDDDDMDELGADDDDIMGVWVISSPGSYRRQVKDLFQALKRNKSRKVKKNWKEINHIWSKLKPDERRMVKKPDAILREAGKENMQMMILVTGKTKEQIQRVGKKKPGEVETPEAEAMESDLTESMGFDEDLDELGADDDLDDDLDELGADDDDLDDDLDELGADEDDIMGGTALVKKSLKKILFEQKAANFLKSVKSSFTTPEEVKSTWIALRDVWLSIPKETRQTGRRKDKRPSDYLKEAAAISMSRTKLATGLSDDEIQSGKTGFASMGYAFGADDDLDDDLDELGADDDDLDDELDALGADDDLDDDLDDMLGGEDDEDLDDDDFGEDLEQSLDLEMQRALVNRYSGSSQAFPAGNAAPFPPPRMAGQEVF